MESVQVAVRVRPLVPNEIETGCRTCIDVIPELQQIVTKFKRDRFTFNHVFDSSAPQIDVYQSAVKSLVLQLFKGYNATVLAYGQTGSGKTYSMGTCPSNGEDERGIIQRAIADIFDVVNNDEEWQFKISVSFLELYNEQLIDLLSAKHQSVVDLRESNQGICVPGLTLIPTQSEGEVMRCLHQGSSVRTTGATAMNAQSSRSHAIFTIYLHQSRRNNEDDAMTAKFHLVDLAGSERSKRTKAEGKRFQEGVSINRELFILGNVISALGEGAAFVNYRDSKLTRLLQDSLGGNSLTMMLACISPADSNLDESINTLRYADRARKIKNRPVVNQDPRQMEISKLKREIEDLQLALSTLPRDNACPPGHRDLLEKNTVLLEKNKMLSKSLDSALEQTTTLLERTAMAEAARDRMKSILSSLNIECIHTLEVIGSSLTDEQRSDLQTLRSTLDELKSTHEQSETERMKYEEKLCEETQMSPAPTNKSTDSQEEEDETREEYVLHQAKLNLEIEELNKDLAFKEALAAKLVESNSIEASIKCGSDEDMMELKSQIFALLHEKEELEQQLKNQRNSFVDHKLAESRRIRVKVLEEKIGLLNKKVMDQDRIIKMKERNEEKMTKLNSEIMNMKQTKVRLINQMKSEGEKYRQWRSTREQEVCKLRQQNRQKETQFVKRETYYQKQQNVLKRKLEESTSVIKRLKDTLALQKNSKKTVLGNAEKVSQWISQEFTAMVNTLEAERTLDNLIEDRTLMMTEITKLKKSYIAAEEHEKSKINKQIKSLNEDLELRSTQIVDLKQKLQTLDSYQDNKSKNRLDCVQTMADAKIALKYMFETANHYLSELHKEKYAKEAALNELQESYSAVLAQLAEKEEMLKEEAQKLKKVETDYNDKVYLLLRRLKDHEREPQENVSSVPLHDLTNIVDPNQEDQSNRHVIEELQKKIEDLEKQLERRTAVRKSKTNQSDKWNAVITPETRKRFFEEEDEELENLDDSTTDPDWRKTPVFRRMQIMKQESRNVGVKRNIDGNPSCGCKGNCGTKQCSCRKLNTPCTGLCKCEDESCTNKENAAALSSDPTATAAPTSSADVSHNQSTSDDSDISFKKPRLLPARSSRP